MIKHNFTSEQSESLLNALADLLLSDDAYSQAKLINDIGRGIITDTIKCDNSGCYTIDIPGKYADEILNHTGNLSDFFFEVGNVLSSKTKI